MKKADLLLSNLYQPFLIVHPGTHRGAGDKHGLQRIIRALNMVLDRSNALKWVPEETAIGISGKVQSEKWDSDIESIIHL